MTRHTRSLTKQSEKTKAEAEKFRKEEVDNATTKAAKRRSMAKLAVYHEQRATLIEVHA